MMHKPLENSSRRSLARWSLAILALLLLGGTAWWANRTLRDPQVDSGGAAAANAVAPPVEERPDVAFASLDGETTFTVPVPGDPEYDDYLEMLAHPQVGSSLQNSPGYAMPYDPEWRSLITGRREVPKRDHELSGGSDTLERFAQEILAGLQEADDTRLYEQRINETEFGMILWPEFPQSRPYLKIPLWEAWGFNHAKGVSGIRVALQQYGHRKLQLVHVEYEGVREFCNFRLLQDVRIVARDLDNNELVQLEIIPAVVQCNGRFKALNYNG